jgi:hypothetical protein
VSGVKLDRAEACLVRARRRRREGLHQRLNPLDAERLRRRVSAERDGAWRDRPPSPFGFGYAALPRPRPIGARLATRMGELHAWRGALFLDEACDPRERLEMRLTPDAAILWRNPPLGGDCRRLGEDERRAADRASGEMSEMPIVGEAVLAGILAHRRHPDAICQGHAA